MSIQVSETPYGIRFEGRIESDQMRAALKSEDILNQTRYILATKLADLVMAKVSPAVEAALAGIANQAKDGEIYDTNQEL